MTDLTAMGKVNKRALPSVWRSEYLEVSSLLIAGASVTLRERNHFTLAFPSQPGRNRRMG